MLGRIYSHLKGKATPSRDKRVTSTLEKGPCLARIQSLVAAGALTGADEDECIYGAAADIADSIRDEDVREVLRRMGFTDLAANSTDENILDGAFKSVYGLLDPLTQKQSPEYWDLVERAARDVVERAGLDWT